MNLNWRETGESLQHQDEVVVLGRPKLLAYTKYNKQFCSRFRVLKPSESELPLAEFLASRTQNTAAAICGSNFAVTAAVLHHLPSLRLLVTVSAGVNHIDLAECRRRGIAVANAADVSSGDVAEHAVGLLLDVLRRISAGDRFVKSGAWSQLGAYPPLGSKLGGKKVGIVGLGSIGLEVAKRLQAFGCAISYNSKNKKPSLPYTFHPDIIKLAAASDILVICCVLTAQTYHMINRDVLLALGKYGVVVNVARGAVIDEKELVWFLQSGEIAGAGLDVFENEPNVPKELFELDNVVLTPHSGTFTEESFRDLYEHVCGNLEAFFSDKPLLTLV